MAFRKSNVDLQEKQKKTEKKGSNILLLVWINIHDKNLVLKSIN